MIWTLGFTLGCLVAMPVVYRLYRELREEIKHLPRAGQTNGLPHALLGASLRAAIELPAHVKGIPAVVQFASPSCPQCIEEMQVLERVYKDKPFPYVCLYETDLEENVQEFIAKFGHLNLQPITPETARMLGVTVTPLVMLMDENAVVRRVEFRLQKILAAMPSSERRAG